MNFLLVIMASGIARGRVRTTTATESRKMATIISIGNRTSLACRTGVIFLRISGEQRRKRGEREARVACEGRIKNPACPHTIVQAVLAFKYERGYLIGYFETRDPRMFFSKT